MKIYGLMVVRDEAARYLDCCLQWHASFLDGIHVFDDGSVDATVEIATARGATVSSSATAASFLEHEGQVRQASWDAFEREMTPATDDWVLAIDADEFFVCDDDEADVLWSVCSLAAQTGITSIVLPVAEVFNAYLDNTNTLRTPYVRIDGRWKGIEGLRLFQYQPGGKFLDRMACGSAPTYTADASEAAPRGMNLLHYGYALPEDRVAKYDRYSATKGHNPAHVASILAEATLVRWDGPHFPVWRGRKEVIHG